MEYSQRGESCFAGEKEGGQTTGKEISFVLESSRERLERFGGRDTNEIHMHGLDFDLDHATCGESSSSGRRGGRRDVRERSRRVPD